MKSGILILLAVLFSLSLEANNVRLVKEAFIKGTAIVDNVAMIEMDVAWDNSWRDDFNWDAVYIFLKYKRKTESTWKHVYLMDGGHQVGSDYEYEMAKSENTSQKCMGIFVQRSSKGNGSSKVSLKLRWLITKNNLTVVDFMNDNVEYQASCIEMVYVPVGAYCLGDGISEKTFQRNYRPILAEWDCLSQDTSVAQYWASGNSATDAYRRYPPENAANRINNRTDAGNAWVATENGECIWQVDFKNKPKAILYFGVSGLASSPNNRPLTWELRAKNDDSDWITLWSGGTADWYIGTNSYPVQRALEVNRDKLGNKKYRYYQIHVITTNYPVIANNIAMTEVDMKLKTNDAFVVDRPSGIIMDNETNLSAKKDGDTWSGTLQANYPTGFNSFYAMKYEVSQEQWVRFLNKLEYNQQKIRTVGDRLDALGVGRFVYGQTGEISCRNGIAVGSREKGTVVFVNNLTNDSKGEYAQPNDGQTVACNYLSPADMLAYADWCGLRPLSEMEYEKMARPPYPSIPILHEWTGGEPGAIVRPSINSISNARTADECFSKVDNKHVNINAGGILDGPVRVGSMAVGARNRAEAGASFWGIMDLSGNLSEIYYACSNGHGRNFSDVQESHGNGDLVPNTTAATAGNTDISVNYWPQTPQSFILRGGNFRSPNENVAISDRTGYGHYSGLNVKDSIATFRLGHSMSKLEPVSTTMRTTLTLMNGKESLSDGSAVDSVCSQAPYVFRGTHVPDISGWKGGAYSYIWYKSEDNGTTWSILPGEDGCNLTYRDFRNESGTAATVLFKRRTVTTKWSEETKYVTVKVINTAFTFNRLVDTISMANHCLGYWVDTKTPATYIWKWWNQASISKMVNTTPTSRVYDFYAPLRKDFDGKYNETGDNENLICEINFMGRCVKKQNLKLHIVRRPQAGVESTSIAINASNPSNECGAVLVDRRGAKTEYYKTVRIGSQCWFAENLRYEVPNHTVRSSYDPTGEVLGFFYIGSNTLKASACPAGWRIATTGDFGQLITHLNNSYGSDMAGIMLKQGAYWWFDGGSRPYLGDNRTGFGAVGTPYYRGGYGWYGWVSTDTKGHHFFANAHFGAADYNQYYYYLSWNGPSISGWLETIWDNCYDGYDLYGNYHGWHWHDGPMPRYRGWQYYNYYFSVRCIKQ